MKQWEISEEEVEVSTADLARCIKQFAPNVVVNVKFHSSLQKVSLFIAEIAMQREGSFNSSF